MKYMICLILVCLLAGCSDLGNTFTHSIVRGAGYTIGKDVVRATEKQIVTELKNQTNSTNTTVKK